MGALGLALLLAALTAYAAKAVEVQLLGRYLTVRALASIALLSLAVWLLALMKLALWMRVPGAYGPVQYSVGSKDADSFMGIRTLALFAVVFVMMPLAGVNLVSIVYAAIRGLVRRSASEGWRRVVTPAIGLAIFVPTYHYWWKIGFFPSA